VDRRKTRVVAATPGSTGTTAGAKIITRAARRGMDVIYIWSGWVALAYNLDTWGK
jgi:methylmalonyl-CoA mutase cobalamin-binding subunit